MAGGASPDRPPPVTAAEDQPPSAIVEAQARALQRQGAQFALLGAGVYADLAERLARDPAVAAGVLGEDVSWDIGLRLFSGVHHLVLRGVAPLALSGRWEDFADALVAQRAPLSRWMVEQGVQTNEVQRCVGLLPAFLTVARETGLPLELLELGPSAGLNLQLDRYRYRYAAGEWGDPVARVVLAATEERPVPATLLATALIIRARRGVDLSPIDATSDEGLLLLRSFLWPGSDEREQRLEAAVATLRASDDRPALIRGDYVELLPGLLADRPADAVTVVFQTASTAYLPPEGRLQLSEALDAAAADGRPLAWISTRSSDQRRGDRDDAWEVELRVWPGRLRHVAHLGFHGTVLDWVEGHGG